MNKTIELPKEFKLNFFIIFAFIIFSAGLIMIGKFLIESDLSKYDFLGLAFMIVFLYFWIKTFIRMLLTFNGEELVIIDNESVKYVQKLFILRNTTKIRKEKIKEIVFMNIQNSKYETIRMLGHSDYKVLITYNRRKKVLVGKFLNQNEAIQLAEKLNSEL